MNQTFEAIEKNIGPVVEIEERVPVWRMRATFSRDYQLIGDYITEQQADFTSMPYAHYLDMNWERE